MSRAISGWLTGLFKTGTAEIRTEYSMQGSGCAGPSFTNGSLLRTSARARRFVNYVKGSLHSKSSKTKPTVEALTVFDILNAGPRNRFMVLTDSGPLIVHNCGYMLGAGEQRENHKTGVIEATGLLGYAWNMGVDMTPEQSALSVKVFRDTFEDVVQFWYDMERAARRCIITRRPQRVGFIRFDISGPFMRMHLPSGHPLFYYKPRIENRRTPWGKMKPTITYEGLKDGRWARQPTHPGKLVENATQAVARDVLAHGLRLAKREGLDTRLHVHDQAVPLIREEKAEAGLKVLNECMSVVPDWAPGLILGSEGTIAKVFMKD